MGKVAIIMGSTSDLPVMEEAMKVLKELGVEYKATVVSAHRTPDRLSEFAKRAVKDGFKVIIAGAGGAAHLPALRPDGPSLGREGVVRLARFGESRRGYWPISTTRTPTVCGAWRYPTSPVLIRVRWIAGLSR